MKYLFSIGYLLAAFIFLNQCGFAQPISYFGKLTDRSGNIISKANRDLFFIIARDNSFSDIVFFEKQKIQTDEKGVYKVNIGRGQMIRGIVDSIVWSDGSYFLKIISDTVKTGNPEFLHQCQLRAPTEITPNGLDGSAESSEYKDWGIIAIPNKNRKSPKKITVDLTTAYINIDYPAGKYPIFRHYEWYDPDGDGNGNSLALTYSEKTAHAFFENSNKLGEVKLYEKAFQEMTISINSEQIILNLSKPEPVQNLGITYAVKGPWKILYYIEW